MLKLHQRWPKVVDTIVQMLLNECLYKCFDIVFENHSKKATGFCSSSIGLFFLDAKAEIPSYDNFKRSVFHKID